MDDMRIGTLFTVLLPLLLVAEAVVGVLVWRFSGHPMPTALRKPLTVGAGHAGLQPRLVGLWLVASVATLWIGFLVAFVGVHLLLFVIGETAARIGLFASVAVLGAVPVAWAFVLFRRAQR